MTKDKKVLEFTQQTASKSRSAASAVHTERMFIEQANPNDELRVGRKICDGVQLVFEDPDRTVIATILSRFASAPQKFRVVHHIDEAVESAEAITDAMIEGVAASEYEGYTELVEFNGKYTKLNTGEDSSTMGWQLTLTLAKPE